MQKATETVSHLRSPSGTVLAVSGSVSTTAAGGLLMHLTASAQIAVIGALAVGVPTTIATLVVAVLNYRERRLADVLDHDTQNARIASEERRWQTEAAIQQEMHMVEAALERSRQEMETSSHRSDLLHLRTVQQDLIKKVAANSAMADVTGALQALTTSLPPPPALAPISAADDAPALPGRRLGSRKVHSV